jgi:hypothetical protein
MKTPIQELIDSVGCMAQGLDADELYDYFMKEAERMLEKEKEVIIKANRDGIDMVVGRKHFILGEQYYDKTFNTKER